MTGVSLKHPLASWEVLHDAEEALQGLFENTTEDAEVALDEAAEFLAIELSRPKSDAKTLLKLLHALDVIEVQPLFSEVRVSMSSQKHQRDRSEAKMGGA